MNPDNRTAKSTDADFLDKRLEAQRDIRPYEVVVGGLITKHYGWFYTAIEAAEFRQQMLSRISKNKITVVINEVRFNWYDYNHEL